MTPVQPWQRKQGSESSTFSDNDPACAQPVCVSALVNSLQHCETHMQHIQRKHVLEKGFTMDAQMSLRPARAGKTAVTLLLRPSTALCTIGQCTHHQSQTFGLVDMTLLLPRAA